MRVVEVSSWVFTEELCHDGPMNCPRCAGELGAMDSGEGVTLDFCRGCGGVWLDAGEMAELMQFLEAEPPSGIEDITSMQLTCPSCGGALTEVEHPPESEILIDICTACAGVWLDRGELVKLRRLGRSEKGRIAFVEAHRDSPVQAHAPKADAATEDGIGSGVLIVPLLTIDRSEEGTGIHWKWVLLSTLIMLAGLGGVFLITEAMIIADSVGRDGHETSVTIASALCVGAFFLGGIVCGWKSPGYTLWEPAIAVIPASIVFCGVFAGFFAPEELLWVLGVEEGMPRLQIG